MAASLFGDRHRMAGAHVVRLLTLGAVALALVALSAVVNPASPVSLLSVSDMEKEQKLEHKLNMHVASEELARWDKLNAEIFAKPAAAATQPRYHAFHKKKAVKAPVAKVATSKLSAALAHPAVTKAVKAEAPKKAAVVTKAPAHPKAAKPATKLAAQPKAAKPAAGSAKKATAVKQQLNGHLKPAEQAGLGDDEEAETEAEPHHEEAANEKTAHDEEKEAEEKEVAEHEEATVQEENKEEFEKEEAEEEEEEAEKEEGSQQFLGDDIFDLPVANGEDEGDVQVPGNVLGQYMYGGFKQTQQAQLMGGATQQQLGFLGEGPWTDVPTEGFGTGRGVGENRDGANGIPVDQEAWSQAAQARYMQRPPCKYRGEGGKEVDGHEGLTNGDCDEFFGREMDIDGHGWPDKYPSTYDAWTGNTHGLFKAPHAQQLTRRLSAPVPAMGAANEGRPLGLAPLAAARGGARYPGLGVFAAPHVLPTAFPAHLAAAPKQQMPQQRQQQAQAKGRKKAGLKGEVAAALRRFEARHPERAAPLAKKRAAANQQRTMLAELKLGDERFFTGMDQQAPATQLRSAAQWANEVEHSTLQAPMQQLTHTLKTKGDGVLPPGEYKTHEAVHCIGNEKWGPCVDETADSLESKVVKKETSDCTSDEDCDTYNWQNFFKDKEAGQQLALVHSHAAHHPAAHHPPARHPAKRVHATRHDKELAGLRVKGHAERNVDGAADRVVPMKQAVVEIHRALGMPKKHHVVHHVHAKQAPPARVLATPPAPQLATAKPAPHPKAVAAPAPAQAQAQAAPAEDSETAGLLGLSDKDAAKDMDDYWDNLNEQDGLGPLPV